VASQPWRRRRKKKEKEGATGKKSESANHRIKVRTDEDEDEDARLLREGSQWTPRTLSAHIIQERYAVA
jgi:hypothetical protein